MLLKSHPLHFYVIKVVLLIIGIENMDSRE
jgi:hypothetical protein